MARRRPAIASIHADWLRLIETSGPFLSLPVLVKALDHGLDAVESDARRRLRDAYEDWTLDSTNGHAEWLSVVIRDLLEHEEHFTTSFEEWKDVTEALRLHVDEHAEMLWPQLVIHESGEPDEKTSRLLVCIHPRSQKLEKGVAGSRWAASPQSRMAELCRATGVRLGLVTNGEQWCLVDAPRDETVGYATWYAQLWLDEPNTFAAFRSLFGRHRFFAAGEDETLESLLTRSRENQHEVTDQLGLQVRRAVEMLVRTLDRADQDLGGELLKELEVGEIYEAVVTVMMRLVFLFSAEERGLLLLGDPLFDQYYAVSTLCEQLREVAEQHGEEILERRKDAWCRLLAAFRAVHSGVIHHRLQIPAYGGGLFDPDRFPFLEGRQKGTTWQDSNADPLPIDNRTVLHCLESLQYLQTKIGRQVESRRLSFRALDIEQIGHVYEGLLDHTAVRANGPTLGLNGKDGDEPEIELEELESLSSQSRDKLVERLAKLKVKSSKRSVETLLDSELDADRIDQIRRACATDELWRRVEPLASLIRDDDFGHPIVILEGQLFATAGLDRRSTGTHYTPRSLTEPIIEHTLEPLVYEGPAEGTPRDKWRLRSPKQILDLKVCDMACGSGAFLVQACRYLGDRLVESWTEAEQRAPEPNPGKLSFSTIDYEGLQAKGDRNLVPKDPDERLLTARRIIAQRCLYGVDVNPVAAEMAKLSIWLLTLSKDKPFSFLDHAIRSGDSLLGIHDIRQLRRFSLDLNSEAQTTFSSMPITELIDQASGTRVQIELLDSDNIGHVRAQARLLDEVETRTGRLNFAADMLISGHMQPAANATERDEHLTHAAVKAGQLSLSGSPEELHGYSTRALLGNYPFHWYLEFPEVLAECGFDAVIGNPPYRHGSRISSDHSTEYLHVLLLQSPGAKGTADLVIHFLRRAFALVRPGGAIGLVTTKSVAEGDNKASGFQYLLGHGATLIMAERAKPWPGDASVSVAHFCLIKGDWQGHRYLDGKSTTRIHADLTSSGSTEGAMALELASKWCFKGSELLGDGFLLSEAEAQQLLSDEPQNADIIKPILNGQEFATSPSQTPTRFVIDFFDLNERDAREYDAPFQIVEARVKPARQTERRKARRERYWRFGEIAKGLYKKLSQNASGWARLFTCEYWFWDKVEHGTVYTNGLVIVPRDSPGDFAVLTSCIHEAWALSQGSSLDTRFRYTPSRCFNTFPFPEDASQAETIGKDYRQARSLFMSSQCLGLTDTYARFHSRTTDTSDLTSLRELHVKLDTEILHAYGWDDLAQSADHDFYPMRRSERFTIHPDVRAEVLSRLLALNHERYAYEVQAGLHDRKLARKNPVEVDAAGAPGGASTKSSLFQENKK